MTEPTVTIRAWKPTSSGEYLGRVIGVHKALDLQPRFNQPGPWSMSLPVGEQALGITKKHLLTFDFLDTRMTGVIEKHGPALSDTNELTLDFAGLDALSLLGDALCYPDPAGSASDQLRTRYRDSGPAETVLRKLVIDNVAGRLGYPITVPTSQGRGGQVTVNLFFKNLLEVVLKKCRAGGLGVRLGLVDTTSSTRARLQLEFYEPQDKTRRVILSPDLGTVTSWKQEDVVPTGTRAATAAALTETPYTIASVSTANDSLTISGGADARHHLRTGSLIRFRGSGTNPSPLEDGGTYYAIRVDANTFKVAKTRAKALAGTALDLTTSGSGTIKVTEVSRLVREVVDKDAEAEWGRRRETFVDARDEDSDEDADITERGREALSEMTEQNTFDMTAVDTEGMRLGTHYQLGDRVTIALLPDVRTAERLGAVRLVSSTDSTARLELVPGNPDNAHPFFTQNALILGVRQSIKALEQEDA